MSDILGNALKLVLFGESHGPAIGASLVGLPSGIKIDEDFINAELNKRKANDNMSTARQEDDEFKIISGVYNGYTTGNTLTIIIENKKQHSSDYKDYYRPGHADYTGNIRYEGFNDPRGGGHFSGRLTAPIVAVCAIISKYLQDQGIFIGSHIKEIHGIKDDEVSDVLSSIKAFNKEVFPVLNATSKEKMKEEILNAKANLDSVGGVIETFVYGLKEGVGNPFFDSLESLLSHALFSIPAVKGVSFGAGFDFANMYGSEANDAIRNIDGKVVTLTNNNGGINGGISNGMPISFKSVIKPTPSIYRKQQSINSKLENVDIEIVGRHDPCIVRRALVVVNSLTAFTILDAMLSR